MALTGASYQAIADELGYANRGTVYRLVKNALEDRQVETIDELRRLEVYRLDAPQVAIWDHAKAVAAVLRIDRVLNGRDLAALDQFVAEDFVRASSTCTSTRCGTACRACTS